MYKLEFNWSYSKRYFDYIYMALLSFNLHLPPTNGRAEHGVSNKFIIFKILLFLVRLFLRTFGGDDEKKSLA